jgi:hypothetical protein
LHSLVAEPEVVMEVNLIQEVLEVVAAVALTVMVVMAVEPVELKEHPLPLHQEQVVMEELF